MITELKKEINGLQIGFPEQKEKLESLVLGVAKELDARFDRIRELEEEVDGLESNNDNLELQIEREKTDKESSLPNENLYDTQKNEVLKRMHRNLTLEELNTLEGEAKMLMRNGRQYAL